MIENLSKLKNQEQINALKPERIGTVNGVTYYEHPVYGDEAPLIINKAGFWYYSDELELPEAD
ncbi:MAG: hypothetical protein KOO69_05840 [Victivallales bacterium]|nr:hypothetical protein [Victivallales bacterium]